MFPRRYTHAILTKKSSQRHKAARIPFCYNYFQTMISTVVLTHNSEKTLGNTLGSLGFSDEIIVVDDESTDKTRQIARMYKATVFERSLNDDFSAQRNYGLEKAKGDWVLFIDADEIVPSSLVREIETVTSASNKNISGYFISRQDYFGGRGLKHGETSHVLLLRLAKNMQAYG